jgi:hypothetical protein
MTDEGSFIKVFDLKQGTGTPKFWSQILKLSLPGRLEMI